MSRADALQLARRLREEHDEDEARVRFLIEVGKPPFARELGARAALDIWASSAPTPPAPDPSTFHPPKVQDPVRDRYQIHRALLQFGIKPLSLAASVWRLHEELGWSVDEAVEWGRGQMKASNRFREPWLAESERLLREARRTTTT